MAANTGLPLCHFKRPEGTSTSCQLGVMAITNKGFSKEEIQGSIRRAGDEED